MYAIVRSGAKQYRVERGQRLLVERVAADEGASVKLEPLLYRAEETVTDRAALERVSVTAKVLEHVRGEKLRVFKFKPKRGYKRRTGHRQALTRIEVTEIATEAARAAAPARDTPAREPKAAAKGTPRSGAAKPAEPAGATKAPKPAAGARPAKPPGGTPGAKPAGTPGAKPAGGAKSAKPPRAAKPDKPARAAKPDKPARAAKPDKPAGGAKGADGAKGAAGAKRTGKDGDGDGS